MQNINITNHKSATDFDINNIAEFLLIKNIERINEVGGIFDGQIAVFIVTTAGFKVLLGHQDNIQDLIDLIQEYKGIIILKSFTRFNSLNPLKPIHEITINKMGDDNDDEHILTATIEHDSNWVYFASITKVRGNKI